MGKYNIKVLSKMSKDDYIISICVKTFEIRHIYKIIDVEPIYVGTMHVNGNSYADYDFKGSVIKYDSEFNKIGRENNVSIMSHSFPTVERLNIKLLTFEKESVVEFIFSGYLKTKEFLDDVKPGGLDNDKYESVMEILKKMDIESMTNLNTIRL